MRRGLLALGIAAAALLYVLSVQQVSQLPRPEQDELLRVRVPPLLQLLQAGGDRYLAADLAVLRSMMVGGRVTDAETYRVQAALQQDAARFNPRHEDNYYIAAAILPWQGHVQATQDILARASAAREHDMLPPFFYAFNAVYFERDGNKAGRWAELAAERAGAGNAPALRAMAAKWYERGDDPDEAIMLIERMKAATADRGLIQRLDARIARLQGLKALRAAAQRYMQQQGRAALSLDELIQSGQLAALPHDPMGFGYSLDEQGVPVLNWQKVDKQ